MDDLPIEILVLPERPAAREDEVTEFDVAVEVRCRTAEATDRRGGAMNLCLVIDRSGSMAGQDKLEVAKRSCVDIFRRITGDDLFTVVVFDSAVQVVVNPQTPGAQVEEKLKAIRPGGATNLSLGWYQGLLELQSHMTDEHYGRLILLSDGLANEGETKKAALASVASRARDEGITTSTIGIGGDFQEEILDAIATASGGRFWYISESGIDTILEEEFRSALTVVLDRPKVELILPDGVSVSEELNSLRKTSRGYALRPLKGQDTYNFAVRLQIDPAHVGTPDFTLRARLYDSTREVTSTEQTITLAPQSEVVTSPVHPLVNSVVEQYRSSQTEEKMLEDMDSRELGGMKEMLEAEVARMKRAEAGLLAQRSMLDPTRWQAEWDHLDHHLSMSETAMLVNELMREYFDEPEIQDLFNVWRKSFMHEKQRKRGFWRLSKRDDEVEVLLLVEAIGVTDTLIQRLPDSRADLEQKRESLREQLARIQ
ncbi:vWA domain-containing protein [Streptomyces spongiae]|uniref:VWA domain-containing protein n=1 Tax=Streptomyces spongiae TaxID=565072 RepID=A0A5N8XNW6_9ACTN|nr:VWA domain-containing protein [Streptomyces spongiae]MPY61099.1 VWA domain-containing protein [Streptomyces spongiae]